MSAAITIGGLVPWTWSLVDSDDIAAGLPCTWVRSAVPGGLRGSIPGRGFRAPSQQERVYPYDREPDENADVGPVAEEVLELLPGEIVSVEHQSSSGGYSGIETVDAVELRNGSRRRFHMPYESDHVPGSSFFLASYRSAPRAGAWTLLLGYAQPKVCRTCGGNGVWLNSAPFREWMACIRCDGEGFAE